MPRVMIVEDDMTILSNLSQLLQLSGLDVIEAHDGRMALDLLSAALSNEPGNLPRMIVSDLMMPKMDGFELLHAVRTTPGLHVLPFVLLSARSEASDLQHAFFLGASDYLIKPFTASTLSDRVVRIFNRKARLAEAYKAAYDGQYLAVPEICEGLETRFPQYLNELERMRIESFFWSGQLGKTEKELLDKIERAPKPWMHLLLAKVNLEKKDFEEAGGLLATVVKTNPEYLAASDLYADVLWEQNKPGEALEVLEKMGAKALASTIRLRKLADLAVRIGDNTRSKNYLTKVIDRSRNTSLSQIHDYLQLSKIYVKEGRHEEAEKLTAKMRTTVNSTELDLARSMMAIQKEIADGRGAKASEKLTAFFETYAEELPDFEPETLTSLLELCFSVNMDNKGYALASQITKHKPSKAMLDRIRAAISDFKDGNNSQKTEDDE